MKRLMDGAAAALNQEVHSHVNDSAAVVFDDERAVVDAGASVVSESVDSG
jgi:hypothetical protein